MPEEKQKPQTTQQPKPPPVQHATDSMGETNISRQPLPPKVQFLKEGEESSK